MLSFSASRKDEPGLRDGNIRINQWWRRVRGELRPDLRVVAEVEYRVHPTSRIAARFLGMRRVEVANIILWLIISVPTATYSLWGHRLECTGVLGHSKRSKRIGYILFVTPLLERLALSDIVKVGYL